MSTFQNLYKAEKKFRKNLNVATLVFVVCLSQKILNVVYFGFCCLLELSFCFLGMAPCEGSFVVGISCSTSMDVADGVDDVADVVDGVTFAASHAAFSTLVTFCPGSYCFPVSPSYNFLGVTWNSSEMVEVISLLLNKCFCKTVWITAARQRVGCLGGRTANAGWNSLGKHWFMLISSLVSWGVKCNFKNFQVHWAAQAWW